MVTGGGGGGGGGGGTIIFHKASLQIWLAALYYAMP